MKKPAIVKFRLAAPDNNGFTLAEILVVLGILSVILVVLTEIFFSSIRGGNKTQIISSLNENGRVIIDMMDKNVRNADAVICPAFPTSGDPQTQVYDKVLVTLKNGVYTRYRFEPPTEQANGKIVRDHPIPGLGVDLNTFINGVCNARDVAGGVGDKISVIDTNTQLGVSVAGGIFTRRRVAGFKDNVTIDFYLQPAIKSSQKIPGNVDTIRFTTTIEVR